MGLATCYYRQIEGELSNDWEEFICILDILKVLALPQPERFELCWRISLRHVANLDWLWLCFRWFSRGPFDPAPGPHLSIRFCPPPVLTQSWDRLAPSSPHRPLVLSPSSRRSLQRSKPHRHGCHSPSSCARVGVEATRPLKDRGALAARGIGVHRSPRRPISLPLVYPVAQSHGKNLGFALQIPTPHPHLRPPLPSLHHPPSAAPTTPPPPHRRWRRRGGLVHVVLIQLLWHLSLALLLWPCVQCVPLCLPFMLHCDWPCLQCVPAGGRTGTTPTRTGSEYTSMGHLLQFSNHFFQACLLSSSFCLLLLVS